MPTIFWTKKKGLSKFPRIWKADKEKIAQLLLDTGVILIQIGEDAGKRIPYDGGYSIGKKIVLNSNTWKKEKSDFKLYLLLHETAHVALKHKGNYIEHEIEAEKWIVTAYQKYLLTSEIIYTQHLTNIGATLGNIFNVNYCWKNNNVKKMLWIEEAMYVEEMQKGLINNTK